MANNKTMQILRTDGITNVNKDVALLDGQPFYNRQKNYLTIGKKTDGKAQDMPITVPTVEGWFDDIASPTIATDIKYLENVSDGATNKYYIKPSKHYFNDSTITDMLEIHSSGIRLDGAVKVNEQIDFGEDNPNIDYNVRINSYNNVLKINSNRREVDSGGNEKITPGQVDIFGGAGIRLSSTPVGSSASTLNGATINLSGYESSEKLIQLSANTSNSINISSVNGISLKGKTAVLGGEFYVSDEQSFKVTGDGKLLRAHSIELKEGLTLKKIPTSTNKSSIQYIDFSKYKSYDNGAEYMDSNGRLSYTYEDAAGNTVDQFEFNSNLKVPQLRIYNTHINSDKNQYYTLSSGQGLRVTYSNESYDDAGTALSVVKTYNGGTRGGETDIIQLQCYGHPLIFASRRKDNGTIGTGSISFNEDDNNTYYWGFNKGIVASGGIKTNSIISTGASNNRVANLHLQYLKDDVTGLYNSEIKSSSVDGNILSLKILSSNFKIDGPSATLTSSGKSCTLNFTGSELKFIFS